MTTEDEALTRTVDTYGTVRYRNGQGQLHREGGPAFEYQDGSRWWYQNGKLHRVGGPAVEWGDGREEWRRHGVLHREDGPAIVWPAGVYEEWWLDGQQVTRDQAIAAQAWDEGYRATGYAPGHGENPYKPCTCCQPNPTPDTN